MSGYSIICIFWLFSISHLTSVEQLYIKVHGLSTNSPGQSPLQMERMMKFVQRKSSTPSLLSLLWPLWCVRRRSFDSGLHEGEINLIPNPLLPSHTTRIRIRIRMSFIGQVCLHIRGICYSDNQAHNQEKLVVYYSFGGKNRERVRQI